MTGTFDHHGRARRRTSKEDEPATPEQIDTWVEHTIRQAQRRGDFDDLPGAGKPLASLDRPDDPDWWLRDLIRREKLDLSAALPGPMALRRERATYPEALLGIAGEEDVRAVLEDFNQRVLDDRRRPVATAASPVVAGRVDVDDMVHRWRDLRAGRREQGHGAGPAEQDPEVGHSRTKEPADRSSRAARWMRRHRRR
ncbi:MAG: DUF1992 domain-containing protein [Ornithinimicrobium sp.]